MDCLALGLTVTPASEVVQNSPMGASVGSQSRLPFHWDCRDYICSLVSSGLTTAPWREEGHGCGHISIFGPVKINNSKQECYSCLG